MENDAHLLILGELKNALNWNELFKSILNLSNVRLRI